MHDLDRIEALLETTDLNPVAFERFAQDVLSERYSLLNPISGGSDWGRDADIRQAQSSPPWRLMATKSRTIEGVLGNVRSGLQSLKKHDQSVSQIVTVSPAHLSRHDKARIADLARRHGAVADEADIFGLEFVANQLRRDGHWRNELLGLSSQPITLARLPPSLADNPWGALDLVGRSEELEKLRGSDDVVVVGVPGAGKSRLLKELEDAAFVDQSGSVEQVASDLRWLRPATLVVEDAGLHLELLKRVLSFRRQEPDVFSYRLVTSCWPEDLQDVEGCFQSVNLVHVELLERSELDEVIKSMGVTSTLARAEILNQSEGRAGWVVTLTDFLLKGQTRAPVLSGEIVLDSVNDYFRRIGLRNATGTLAVIALRGSLRSDEMRGVAAYLGLDVQTVRRQIEASATSGLIDVTQGWFGGPDSPQLLRVYTVRPPVLGRALVAELALGNFPVIDGDTALETWPDRASDIAQAVIGAAAQSGSGYSEAERIFRLAAEKLDFSDFSTTALEYAMLSSDFAQQVLTTLEEDLTAQEQGSSRSPYDNRSLVRICALTAHKWQLSRSINLLLRFGLLDERDPARASCEAGRALVDLVKNFHPEADYSFQNRHLIAEALAALFDQGAVAGGSQLAIQVSEGVLYPNLSSAITDPGKPRTLNLIETVLPPALMQSIPDVWVALTSGRDRADHSVLTGALNAIEQWFRVGLGYDHPFGNSHSDEAIAEAERVANQLLDRVGRISSHSIGIAVRVNRLAKRFKSNIRVEILERLAPFFEDIDDDEADEVEDVLRHDRLRSEQIKRHTRQLAGSVAPENLMADLKLIKDESVVAGGIGLNPVFLACEEIASTTSDSLTWLRLALQYDVMPEGGAFIADTVAQRQMTPEMTETLLVNSQTRGNLLRSVLTATSCDETIRDRVLADISYSDAETLQIMVLREEVSTGTLQALLRRSDGVASGAAIALGRATAYADNGVPDEILDDWREAVRRIDFQYFSLRHHAAESFLDTCLRHAPQELCDAVISSIEKAESAGRIYNSIPFELWERLRHLPSAVKSRLAVEFANADTRRFVSSHLVGVDYNWMTEAIEGGLLSPQAALDGLANQEGVDLEKVAPVLISRGIRPEALASIYQNGGWTGEWSSRYSHLVGYFREFLSSNDVSVRRVAIAGVKMFEEKLSDALESERRARIRGEL